jgi:hypothetical protein
MEIEMKIAFESEQQVTDMISHFDGINIEWFSGTLFLDFDAETSQSEKTARLVWHFLIDKFGLEHVRISKYADNYAIDFV